jgi:uncharacterized membrane protein YraQ (UPF0718 family)
MLVLHAILSALALSASMAWEILWALLLGFILSAVVQAVVSKKEMSRLLPDSSPRTIVKASALGAASSSCSYAAVALARSMFRQGADFTAAIAFQFASTNLVIELGILLAVLMGWQFTLAEFTGGPIMIVILVLLFRAFLKPSIVAQARRHAEQNLLGRMEGHAAMDMSIHSGPIWRRAISPAGRTSISHYFIMDWSSLWADLVLGLVLAGALGAWVPHTFWQGFFLHDHPALAALWGPLAGPLVAIVSFVCSIGNVPLAAVLWAGGISFGGVVSFLFADLIILPILDIYRKYYGLKIAIFLFATFYLAMAGAGYVVEILFRALHLIPSRTLAQHSAHMLATISWNYTTILNILFIAISIPLIIRFFRTGGPAMLRMMGNEHASGSAHAHHCAHHDDAHSHHAHHDEHKHH